ncbi:MAG: uroporphyrinogen-III C-methyltransferase [Thermoleophilia bacterium]|nr:uroporphyrinogen-III C-methyltransferase [Thermoleophilia bacterium]
MNTSDERDATGAVYLVGAGPGDHDLLTLGAAEVIAAADVVVYDRLVDRTILDLASADAEMVYVGKQPGAHSISQDGIHQILLEKALEKKRVVRLKGGDPFVFGRGGEEASFLSQHGIRFFVVPGVTSAVAAPAYAGIPVTDRRCASSFAVVTGHEAPSGPTSRVDWACIAKGSDTLVVLMGLASLGAITGRLIREGRAADTPAAVIERGTTTGQRVVVGELTNIAERAATAEMRSPTVLVVGEVVRLRETVAWRNEGHLTGKRILVPRALPSALDLPQLLRDAGAEVTVVPSLTLRPETPPPDLLERLRAAEWVVFVSPRAVDVLLEHMEGQDADIRELAGRRLVAVDEFTHARLRRARLRVDCLPRAPADMTRGRVLIVGGEDEVNEVVSRAMESVHPGDVSLESVDQLVVYSYHKDERFPIPPLGEHDAVVLSDAMAVRAYCGTYSEKPNSRQLVLALGASAVGEARSLGVRIDLQAVESEGAELARLIADELAR